MKRNSAQPFLLAVAVLLAGTMPACRTGIFDNENSQWRVPESQLRQIDSVDPAARSTTPPVTLEEAAKKTLSEVAVPAVPADAVSLSLADVRSAVLANNLDLRTALVDPAIARANLSAEEAKFENVFFASYDRSNNSVFADLATGQPAETEAFDAGLRIPLATGGDINLSAPLSRTGDGFNFGTPGGWAGRDGSCALGAETTTPLAPPHF